MGSKIKLAAIAFAAVLIVPVVHYTCTQGSVINLQNCLPEHPFCHPIQSEAASEATGIVSFT